MKNFRMTLRFYSWCSTRGAHGNLAQSYPAHVAPPGNREPFRVRFRACLKNHFRNLQAPLCGIFYPHSVAVARYAALIRIKSPTNWDSQLTKSLFQTRSNSVVFGCQFLFLRSHRYDPDKQPADLYPLPLTVTSQSSQSPAFCPVPLPPFSSPSLSD